MPNQFEVTYGNDDGYVGNGKFTFYIREGDLCGDETEEDLSKLFWEMIESDFDSRHKHLFSGQESEFVGWALAANKTAELSE